MNRQFEPNSMCNWNSLLYSSISQTAIKSIPDCVSNLKLLKRAEIQQCFYLDPKQLFPSPNIISVIVAWSNIQNTSFDNNDIRSSSSIRIYLFTTSIFKQHITMMRICLGSTNVRCCGLSYQYTCSPCISLR